jgi:hypothetical protein
MSEEKQFLEVTPRVIEFFKAIENTDNIVAIHSKQDVEDLIHALKVAVLMLGQDTGPLSVRLLNLKVAMEALSKEGFDA